MNIPTIIEQKKQFFGTYSVMALLNVQTVLDHIQKLADIEDIPCYDENGKEKDKRENLWEHSVMLYINYKNNSIQKAPEKTALIIDKLMAYFPFLKIMAENQRTYKNKKYQQNRLEVNSDDVFDVLNCLFRVVKKYRDTTTHYMLHDECWDDNSKFLRCSEQILATMLNKYYDVALRNMKERYGYTTEELAFIQNHRYKIVWGPDRRKRTQSNTRFFFSLVDNNGDANLDTLHLSGIGVAVLICLLLDKQYINLFVQQLPAIQKFEPQSAERKMLVRSMGIHSIVLPKDRIHSQKDNMSIAMDMINEMKRCPKELFDTLSPSDQSRFRVTSSDHNEVLFLRHNDRFAQLALQYIDYCKWFNGIRFHVNMGKLRYLFNAEKNCIDGINRVRVIEHALNGFGRIDEMEDLRKSEVSTFANTGVAIRDFENVKRDDADPNNYPYIVDTYTHYILENNKIEMLLTDTNSLPTITEKGGKWYVGKKAPTCRMSIFELPAMMFHAILLGNQATEKRIKTVCANYSRLFEALKQGAVNKDNIASFGIAEEDIPQKVLDIVNGCAQGKDVNIFIKKNIDEMLHDTERRLERLREDREAVNANDNRMGKRGFRQIQRGKLASFLAEDIVKLQPTLCNGTDKLTGLNYRVLQASLAVYDSGGMNEARQQFKELFVKAHLLGTDPHTCHPFLHKVFARSIPDNTIDFYERYLAERESYLSAIQKKVAMGKAVNVPFINRAQSKWSAPTQEALGNAYTDDMAIELPRQMFDDEIKAHLKTLPEMADIDFDNANITFLIGEYQKRVLHDNVQHFYSWQRNYRYIDMLKCETDRKNSLCSTYTSVEEREALWERRKEGIDKYRQWFTRKTSNDRGRSLISAADIEEILDKRLSNARNEYQKCEKTIRRFKVQDTLLFVLAKKALTNFADYNGERFCLNDITPEGDKGILSQLMPMIFRFEKKGKVYTIKSESMKPKNYGDFFVIANDNRICNLLDLIEDNIVSKEDIDKELQKYDQCRPEMAKLVLDLEKWTYSKSPGLMYKEKVQFKDVLDELCKHTNLTERQKFVLSRVRNAFEHNDYPEKGILEITTLPQIAARMKDLFDEYAEVE